jgi:hypothetical protein
MAAVDTLLAIRAAGGIVTIEGDRLVVDIDRDLPEPTWQAVAEHRDELVRLLSPRPARPEAIVHAIHEAGGAIAAAGDRLAIHLPNGIDGETLELLEHHRDGVHEHLRKAEWADPLPRGPLRQPAGVECCDRCGSTETIDQTIHGGRSTRQDCARCGRFRKFTRWHGVTMP